MLWGHESHIYSGQGRLLTICHTDSPPAYPVLGQMNFPSSITNVLISLNWATAEEDYTSGMFWPSPEYLRINPFSAPAIGPTAGTSQIRAPKTPSEQEESHFRPAFEHPRRAFYGRI